ncbi:MAG: glutamate-1-semialdehyde 2,1-aminomutase [Chlamydiia bacterium]|nr:glutamate-1-semialdehyde 2,1-aminomutase [Chlamydiia bacterium]
MQRPKTESVYAKSCAVMPGGVNSPVRAFRGLGLTPLIVESGQGDLVYDVDGNKYIDYCGSWGALILGHAPPTVVQAACQQMAKGSSFGIATALEEQLASKMVALIHSLEKIRFVSSGTEATMTALRLARGYTGRAKIVKFTGHYHGHSDFLLIQAGSGVAHINPIATSKGVLPSTIADTMCFPFNDFSIRSFFRTHPHASDVAAVIVEPVAGNMGVVPPEKGFLEMLREETQAIGALFIMDEVITGFRVALQGMQGLLHLDPDLSCFGKVIGGGFPVAAFGGKTKILDCLAPLGQVYQAGTLSGNSVAMSAALATLKEIEVPGFYDRLAAKTERLLSPIRAQLEKKRGTGCLNAVGSMFSLFLKRSSVKAKEALDEEEFARFFRYLFERGIYLSPSPYEASFVSIAHTDEHLDYTAKTICEYLDRC